METSKKKTHRFNIMPKDAEYVLGEIVDGKMEIIHRIQCGVMPHHYGYVMNVYCAVDGKIVWDYGQICPEPECVKEFFDGNMRASEDMNVIVQEDKEV